ncbi:MAG: hypothetical protein EOP48_12815 [Sphingobacteriales bacterium]|nr:MAG: hypothetical protein EOP48_12815 [Sphingobacteriales bacterium]
MQSISVTFGRPRVGWLPVQIKSHDFQLSFDASDLGLNVIDQLTDMLEQLDLGRGSECYFYLEPGAYLLNIEPASDSAILQIQFVEDFNNRDISTPKTKFQIEINLMEFRMSLRNALRSFQNFVYGEEDWPTPEKTTLLFKLLNF